MDWKEKAKSADTDARYNLMQAMMNCDSGHIYSAELHAKDAIKSIRALIRAIRKGRADLESKA